MTALRRGYLGLEEGIFWVLRPCIGRYVIGIHLLMIHDDVLVFSTKFVKVKWLSNLSLGCSWLATGINRLRLALAIIIRSISLYLELLLNSLLLTSIPWATCSSSDVSLLLTFNIELKLQVLSWITGRWWLKKEVILHLGIVYHLRWSIF